MSLLGVNLANGVSIRESLHLLSKQIKSTNIDPNVSWPGHFLKYEDRGRWPLFIIYSKKDKLLPWQFLKNLEEETSKNGRQVEEWQLKGSYNEWVNSKQLFWWEFVLLLSILPLSLANVIRTLPSSKEDKWNCIPS